MTMTFGQLAGIIAAIAFLVLVVFMCRVLSRLVKTVSQLTKSMSSLTKDADNISDQVEQLLDKTNTLMADINEKSQKVEPLFDTIVDLSESVSDLNEASRGMVSKIAATAKDTSKMKQASTLFSVGKHAFNAINKAKSKKSKK